LAQGGVLSQDIAIIRNDFRTVDFFEPGAKAMVEFMQQVAHYLPTAWHFSGGLPT
jgi:hypothetical protein